MLSINSNSIDQIVRRRIENCRYSMQLAQVTWHYADGHLTLYGVVPSYHAKQLLQELLRAIGPAISIVNRVEVANDGNRNANTWQ